MEQALMALSGGKFQNEGGLLTQGIDAVKKYFGGGDNSLGDAYTGNTADLSEQGKMNEFERIYGGGAYTGNTADLSEQGKMNEFERIYGGG